ncbi:unnamed protein product, partial [Linum tenue]
PPLSPLFSRPSSHSLSSHLPPLPEIKQNETLAESKHVAALPLRLSSFFPFPLPLRRRRRGGRWNSLATLLSLVSLSYSLFLPSNRNQSNFETILLFSCRR